MSKYTTILFDLDGTLRASQPEGFEAFAQYCGRVGIQLTQIQIELIEREANRYWASGLVDVHMSRYDKREFWLNYDNILLTAIGVTDPSAYAPRIQELYDLYYDPIDVLYSDAFVVLEELRKGGYVLGLVTNRDTDIEPMLLRYRMREYFNFVVTGGQAGFFKPHPEIFRQAIKLSGGPPEKTLYVGDNYFADVVGALNVGMDAVLVDARNVFRDFYNHRVKHLRQVLEFIHGAE